MSGVIIAVLAGNIAIFADADFADYIYSFEPAVKQSILKSQDNNDFRLGVIAALRDETASNSIIFGKFFTGGIDADVSDYLPWWHAGGDDFAPIHSDFIGLLSQGGLAGYLILSLLFIGLARLCMASARFSRKHAEQKLFDAVLVMESIFMIYISFNPIIQKAYFAALFFFLIPACVLTARGIPRRASYSAGLHKNLQRMPTWEAKWISRS